MLGLVLVLFKVDGYLELLYIIVVCIGVSKELNIVGDVIVRWLRLLIIFLNVFIIRIWE